MIRARQRQCNAPTVAAVGARGGDIIEYAQTHGEYIANVAAVAAALRSAARPPTVEAVGAVRLIEVER